MSTKHHNRTTSTMKPRAPWQEGPARRIGRRQLRTVAVESMGDSPVAVYSLSPYVDMVTVEECVALFAETGHPKGESTLRRWIRKNRLMTDRIGGKTAVSWTEMQQIHRDMIARSG
ncbi:hypothetical protein [Streptomyces hebeiensis]